MRALLVAQIVGDFSHAEDELGDLIVRVVGRYVEPHHAPRLALRRGVLGAEPFREAQRLSTGLEAQPDAGRLGVEVGRQRGAVVDALNDRRGEGRPGGVGCWRGPVTLFAGWPAPKAGAAHGWTTRESEFS